MQRGFLLLQYNTRHHSHRDMQNLVQHCGREVLVHPSYSPGLAPCDYCLFASVKGHLRRKQFEL